MYGHLKQVRNRFYAGGDGIFISEDYGHTWNTTSLNEVISTITIDGNSVYAGTVHQGVFRSDDAGVTWKPIRDGLRFYERDDGERRYGKVRRILANRGEVIVVMYHDGTYTSTDWGETWHDVSKMWCGGDSIVNMTEFDGYHWGAGSTGNLYRSPDNGQTWEYVRELVTLGYVTDWAVLDNRLYVAGERGIRRWNEDTLAWEYLVEGFPTKSPSIHNLAVNRGRLYAALEGVYVFDARAETWYSVGLDGFGVYALLSHESALYAGTGRNGIYRATIPRVRPHAKAVTTWAYVKQGVLAK